MNNKIDQKITKLIEESVTSLITNLLKSIGVLPKKILDKIKKKYRTYHLEESQTPAPKIEGTTTLRDTCYTAMLKLIGNEKLIKKYETLDDFIEAYHKKNKKVVKLNDIKIENLKPGTILFYKFKDRIDYSVKRGYGKFGVISENEAIVGHIDIFMGTDSSKNKNKKYVFLGNEFLEDDRIAAGSGLELNIYYSSANEMNKAASEYREYTEVLDYNTIIKM